MDDLNPAVFGSVPLTNRTAAIGRTVIDKDDLDLTQRLADNLIQGPFYIAFYVINWNDY